MLAVLIRDIMESLASLQVAITFADLHDTAGRMHEKGVVSVSLIYGNTNYVYSGSLLNCSL